MKIVVLHCGDSLRRGSMGDKPKFKSIDERVQYLKGKAQEIRTEVIKMIYKAQSGHPGGSLSASDIMAVLYFDELNLGPVNACHPDRDRFVLSKGHACPVWYASLALNGFFPMEVLDKLRQLGSPLQGHPIMGKCAGIDATAGSLGVGLAQAVGMALEAKMRKKDYRVYALCGDGETQEGIIYEAAQTANKFKLDNLVAIIDNNGLQMDGFTKDVMPVEPLDLKFQSFGWETTRIDGHNVEEIIKTFEKAKTVKGKPYCIIAKTVKGKGVSYMENIRAWHGKAPNEEQYVRALKDIREGF
jgi:transketolase